jgi:hypothetical protein
MDKIQATWNDVDAQVLVLVEMRREHLDGDECQVPFCTGLEFDELFERIDFMTAKRLLFAAVDRLSRI